MSDLKRDALYLCCNSVQMFSKACEYGIKALLYVASKSKENTRLGLTDISAEIDSPVSFTAKILQRLVKHKLLDSLKGPTGGFVIRKEKLNTMTVLQVVAAIDGDSLYKGCGLGLKHCSETHPCPLHSKFKSLRDDLKLMLGETTLLQLSTDINKGLTFLKSN